MDDPLDFYDGPLWPDYSDWILTELERRNNPSPSLPSLFEDPLATRLSQIELETEMTGLMEEPAVAEAPAVQVRPGEKPVEEPHPLRPGRYDTPGPPSPEGEPGAFLRFGPDWSGFRPSRTGARSPDNELYCFLAHEYKDKAECEEQCSYYCKEYESCEYDPDQEEPTD